jgi:DNA-binding transcriptional ArsR family regulator
MSLALVGSRSAAEEKQELLNHVFFALSDPMRRAILQRLDGGPALVSELAAPFNVSLQAVSRHIQVLVRSGLVVQERTGRIARCSLDAAPLYDAAVWLNQYTKYWQQQFDDLASIVKGLAARPSKKAATRNSARRAGK